MILRTLRLLALAWVVQILGAIFAMAFGYAHEATRSVWDAAVYIVDPILEGYCWSVGVLWFLTSLCFVQLLAYVLLRRIPALASRRDQPSRSISNICAN